MEYRKEHWRVTTVWENFELVQWWDSDYVEEHEIENPYGYHEKTCFFYKHVVEYLSQSDFSCLWCRGEPIAVDIDLV